MHFSPRDDVIPQLGAAGGTLPGNNHRRGSRQPGHHTERAQDGPQDGTGAAQLPPLSTDEFAALKASCKDGIRDPVLVDDDDNVLDGQHRLKIDPNAPRKVVPGLTTDAEKKAFIYQINKARRSLTPQQKQELAAEQSEVAVALRTDVGSPSFV